MNLEQFIAQYSTESLSVEEHKKRVELWMSWYKGYVKEFHQYTYYNGQQKLEMQMSSLHLAKKVCEDWARLLYNERCLISTDNQTATDNLNTILKTINFQTTINHGVELAMALGTVGYVLELDKEKKKLELEAVTADSVFPLTIENSRVTECAFVAVKTLQGKPVAYITMHQKTPAGLYVIENALYSYANSQIGERLDYWKFETEGTVPWFAVFKPNLVNNFELHSPYGISIFANAEDQMKAADRAFDAMDDEVVLGRMRLIVSTEAMKVYDDSGLEKPVFDARDPVIMRLPKDMNESTMLQCIAPQLRIEDQIRSINASLRLFSDKVGMGTNMYSFDGATGTVKTAAEVVSNNSPLYRSMVNHEILLEAALRTLIAAIADIASRHLSLPIHYKDLTIRFDDSVIEDKNAERQQDEKDVYLGVMSKVEYRMKWYGEDEETATKAVDEAKSNTENLFGSGSEGDEL